MRSTEIKFLEWQEAELPFSSPRWRDALRWWLVRLLGGQCPFDTVKVTRVPVDGKTFMDRLWTQKRTLVESFRREPTQLWMGGEDYAALMNCPQVRQAFNVYSEFNYGRREVYGLTVKVIPWMRGMLVMPENA
jgi:hypothetical protein